MEQAYVETAKEVAGKAIGKQGLFYITLIVIIGVGASLYLDESKIAAVIGLLSSALMALISLLVVAQAISMGFSSGPDAPIRMAPGVLLSEQSLRQV